MNDNQNSMRDLTAMTFSFLSTKVKLIILGIIIGLFFIILIPIIALASISSGDEEENSSTSVVSQGTATASSEVISSEKLYKYEDAQFVMPFETWNPNIDVMTSKYGYRIHPIKKVQSFHTGVDLVVISISNPRIISIESGVVSNVMINHNAYGNAVEICHFLDDGNLIYSFYAHLKDDSISVAKGDIVEKGQTIGVMGSTGWSTGNHLHFEIRTASGSSYHTNPENYIF